MHAVGFAASPVGETGWQPGEVTVPQMSGALGRAFCKETPQAGFPEGSRPAGGDRARPVMEPATESHPEG